MVVPFIALLVIFVVLILFFVLTGKRKGKGKDLGDPNAGA